MILILGSSSFLYYGRYFLFLFFILRTVCCQFTPPSRAVCLGESITYSCVLEGFFSNPQVILYRNLSINVVQINTFANFLGTDISRLNATAWNTGSMLNGFTLLGANITLSDLQLVDNGTLIGCQAIDTSGNIIDMKDFLILESRPPSPQNINLTIENNCTVTLTWTRVSPNSLLSIDYSVNETNSTSNVTRPVYDQTYYFSNPLIAGVVNSFAVTARNCYGDSVPSTVQFTPPSRPNITNCSASITQSKFAIRISYDETYAISSTFSLLNITDGTTVLSGTFLPTSQKYFSRTISNFSATNDTYTVTVKSRFLDCLQSGTYECTAPVIVFLNAPQISTTNISTTTNTTGPSMNITTQTTPTMQSSNIIIYIAIAVVLVVVLVILIVVIFVLVLFLRKKKISKSRSFPAQRLSDSKVPPDQQPESKDPNSAELHYLKPNFSNTETPPRAPAPLPKTNYADIDHAKSALESANYAYIH